jgi:hypothetical protein
MSDFAIGNRSQYTVVRRPLAAAFRVSHRCHCSILVVGHTHAGFVFEQQATARSICPQTVSQTPLRLPSSRTSATRLITCAKGEFRARQQRADGTWRDPDCTCDFVVTKAFGAQQEQFSRPDRKRMQDLTDEGLFRTEVRSRNSVRGFCRRCDIHLARLSTGPPPTRTQIVHRDICRDTTKPRTQRRLGLRWAPVEANERFLRGISCLVFVTSNPKCSPSDEVPMSREDVANCLIVTLGNPAQSVDIGRTSTGVTRRRSAVSVMAS